jgi:hypothetical protein
MLEEKSGPEKATNHFSLVTNHRISSARFYWENKFSVYNAVNVAIPAAVSVFPGENYQAELDRAGVSQTHLLQQARQRRPFRSVGTASELPPQQRLRLRFNPGDFGDGSSLDRALPKFFRSRRKSPLRCGDAEDGLWWLGTEPQQFHSVPGRVGERIRDERDAGPGLEGGTGRRFRPSRLSATTRSITA